MKHIISRFTYLINLFFSREVREAINNGATYEEVEAIAKRKDAR